MRDRVIKRIISTIAKFKQLHCEAPKNNRRIIGRNSLTIYQHPKQQTSIRISHMEEEEGLLMRFFKDGAKCWKISTFRKPSIKSNDFKMTPTISNIDSNLLSSIMINFNGYKINYTYRYMYICIVRVSIRVLTDIRTSINIIGLIAKLNESRMKMSMKRTKRSYNRKGGTILE